MTDVSVGDQNVIDSSLSLKDKAGSHRSGIE
jgi:hypothetical protein